MKRREMLQLCRALAQSSPFFGMLAACAGSEDEGSELEVRFSGKVIVVGAGAAGLAAGYMLARHGVDFEIIEAGAGFGGRVRGLADFVDFPIDLGAEWVHAEPEILRELVDDPQVDATNELVPYSPETLYSWDGARLKQRNFAAEYYSEIKFKDSSWYEFLEQYIVPSVAPRIRYQTPVQAIELADTGVVVRDSFGQLHGADRVLVTVPLTLLQQNLIEFIPPLPAQKREAIASVYIPDGIKVFIEFSERFYPDMLVIGSLLGAEARNKLYYDAAFRKGSNRHVLALFWVGPGASAFTDLPTDHAVIEAVLTELDTIFDGQASKHYLQHRVQNWSREPFIQGSYSFDFEQDVWTTIERIAAPVDNRIYFAGEATSQDNFSTVHGAMQSGYAAVRSMLTTA